MIEIGAYAPWFLALVMIAVFIAFAMEWRSPEITAGIGVAILLFFQVISIDDVLTMLSSTALVTIAAMFVLTAALVRTGAVEKFAETATGNAKSHPRLTLIIFLFVTAILSAFMNNTPVVMLMIPVVARIARETDQSASKLLIPLSYAAILGGTCTLIGTSTNLLVAGVARDLGQEPFHIFEIAPLGIAATLVGITVMLLIRRFLPERTTTGSAVEQQSQRRFIVHAVVEEGADFVGEAVLKTPIFNRSDRRVVDVVRDRQSLRRELKTVILQPGDTVVLRTPVEEVLSMAEEGHLAAPDKTRLQQTGSRQSTMVEVLVGPGARILGKTLRHLRLRRRYGIYPIALHRGGMNMADRFESTPLSIGDTLLIEGGPEDLSRFAEDNNVVNVTQPSARGYRRSKAPIAIGITLTVVVGAALSLMPIAALAMIGAVLVLASRCVEVDEAVQAVDWRILGLIFSMLVMGLAMQETGLVTIIVETLTPWLTLMSPLMALAAVYIMTTILTELVTNNAVAVVMAPIAIGIAASLGLDPRAFLVAVMMAASASFITPIGYQTNTLVYNAGGYRFTDFLRVGIVVAITTFCTAMIVIPQIWPLSG